NHGRVRAGLLHGVAHGVKHRPTLVRRATLARRHTADDVGAVGLRLLRVERAFAAGEALNDEPRVSIDEYGHKFLNHEAHEVHEDSSWSLWPSWFVSASQFDDLLGSLVHRVRGREFHPTLFQQTLAFFDVGPFHANHDRHGHAELFHGGDHALGEHV